MRNLVLASVVLFAACSKSKSAPPAAATDAGAQAARPGASDAAQAPAPADAAPPMVAPGLAADGSAPPLPPPASGMRVVEPRDFRHSSVRGDFRIYRTAAGVVVSWRTLLSARDVATGAPQWQLAGFGRAVAVSADGTRVVANNDDGDIVVLDATTGEKVTPSTRLGGRADPDNRNIYVSAFAWTPDGKHIVAVATGHVYLLGADGVLERELPVCAEGGCFMVSAVPLSNDEVLIADARGSSDGRILKVRLADGNVVGQVGYYGSDPDLSHDGKRFVVDGMERLAAFDAAALERVWEVPLSGHDGVRFATSDEHSSIHFKCMPKLSPNGRYVAANDAAGALWLHDAGDGRPLLVYPPEVAEYVEDVIWLDDATLITIDNHGRVARLAGTPARVVWSQRDAPEPEQWDRP